jgi:hypothetical protein
MTFLVLAILAADCTIPAPKIPKEWAECKKDDDCALASDNCRFCDNYIPVNKAFQTAATMRDLENRLAAKCVKQCPSCPPSEVELKCIDSYCSASKKKKEKAPAATPTPKPAQPAPQPQPAPAKP